MSKIGYKGRAAIQIVFLISAICAAVIWSDALRRGTNDFFIPSLILLYIGVVAITALPQVVSGNIPAGAKWTYGSLCLAVIVMGALLILHNITYSFSFFPSAVTLGKLISDFGLVSIYNVIMNSWLFAMLHMIAVIAGVLSVYMGIKEKRFN